VLTRTQVGHDGVDNGWARFEHVLVPREMLLNRLANVEPDGRYYSSIASPGKRFGAMLAALVGGRVFLHNMSRCALEAAVQISVRYALLRRQFGEPGEREQTLLSYGAHRRRLMPLLAACYASEFTRRELTAMYAARTPATMPEVRPAVAR
jgi:acyl-CoA oxidase